MTPACAISVSYTHLDVYKRQPQKLQYLLFYKPTAVVTTMNDPEGRKCVADFFPVEDFGKLFPVGRLDYETEGLLLMTNDGELSQRLTHPSHEVEKVYEVIVNARMDEEAVGRLRKGVALSEGMTAPAKVTSLSRQKGVTHLTLVIHEGRNQMCIRDRRWDPANPICQSEANFEESCRILAQISHGKAVFMHVEEVDGLDHDTLCRYVALAAQGRDWAVAYDGMRVEV